MKCYDFKVILQLKPSLIQDSSRYSPLFPLGLIISSGFMQMPVLNEGKHLLLHLNLAWSELL